MRLPMVSPTWRLPWSGQVYCRRGRKNPDLTMGGGILEAAGITSDVLGFSVRFVAEAYSVYLNEAQEGPGS